MSPRGLLVRLVFVVMCCCRGNVINDVMWKLVNKLVETLNLAVPSGSKYRIREEVGVLCACAVAVVCATCGLVVFVILCEFGVQSGTRGLFLLHRCCDADFVENMNFSAEGGLSHGCSTAADLRHFLFVV